MTKIFRFTLILSLFCAAFFFSFPVQAQGITATDLINAVNALRAENGLAPYVVDETIMAYAQEHAEYSASIKVSTHTHSDGSSPLDSGYQENVAAGTVEFMTTDFILNNVWADPVHGQTLTGYAGGAMGVGTALDGDGGIYIVLNVLPGAAVSQPVQATAAVAETTPAVVNTQPVAASTTGPRSDTPIIHTVKSGEAMWSIAIQYGVTIAEIQQWNGYASGDTEIYVGQELKVYLPVTPMPEMTDTPIPTATATQPPATATAIPTATQIPTATLIPTPTPPPDFIDRLYDGDRQTAVIVVIIAGIIGVLLVEVNKRINRRPVSSPEKSAAQVPVQEELQEETPPSPDEE